MTEDQWLELKTIYLNLEIARGNEVVHKQLKRLAILLMDTMPEGVRK